MGLVRYLQHRLGGTGPCLHVTDVVPETHPIRRWADTLPWAALVAAVEQSCATRFPKRSPRGRAPVPIRVLLALELLQHELGATDEDICHRWRTDFAVMYACGLCEYQAEKPPAHCVLPETLCAFRGRIDAGLMEAFIAIQAAAAMEEGLVSPAHLVIETFPCEQGSQRVTEATTLYTAQKTPWCSSQTSRSSAAAAPRALRVKPPPPRGAQKSHAVLWPPMPGARARLCDPGAPHGTEAPGAWRAHHHAGAARAATP